MAAEGREAFQGPEWHTSQGRGKENVRCHLSASFQKGEGLFQGRQESALSAERPFLSLPWPSIIVELAYIHSTECVQPVGLVVSWGTAQMSTDEQELCGGRADSSAPLTQAHLETSTQRERTTAAWVGGGGFRKPSETRETDDGGSRPGSLGGSPVAEASR